MNTFTINSTDELETLSGYELGACEWAVKAQIEALKSLLWDIQQERWMRECPSRMAEREAFTTTAAERRAGIEDMAPLTIIAGRANQAA